MLNENINQNIVYTGGNIMPREKVNQLLAHFAGSVSENHMLVLKSKFSLLPEDRFDEIMFTELKNPTTVLLLSLFLGGFGVDCFVLGKIGKGIAKLLFNVFTFGIWWLVDVICCTKQTKEYNFNRILMMC